MSFHMPGDIPDLLSFQLHVMDHSLGTLTRSVVGFIPHGAIRKLIRDHPGVGDLLWRDTLIDGSVFREWLVGVGRRSAHARIAHLLCELYVKMRSLGLADEAGFMLPVSQVELSDALGLSAVHVNRVLQDLRRDGLISGQARKMMIGDWAGLKQAGEFDPLYLHIQHAA